MSEGLGSPSNPLIELAPSSSAVSCNGIRLEWVTVRRIR